MMFDPQTMSDYEARELRDKTFYLVKKYTSFTFLDHARTQYQAFLDEFATQLNNPNSVTSSDADAQQNCSIRFANGFYEERYRGFLRQMIPLEEGLKLLRMTPHKQEAYRAILSNKFSESLGGRGADEWGLDADPFYRRLGYYHFPLSEATKWFLGVQIADGVFEVLKRTLLGSGWHLKNRQRGTYHWTYESFFESYDNTGGRGRPPISYPPVLPAGPPHNINTAGQIWSGAEIPVTGIWEPWFVEEPVRTGMLGGLVDRLAGKAPAEDVPVFTGKVGCPNYFLVGATAFEYEMEGTDKKAKVAWRLIWEDTRYLDGKIPDEEKEYFGSPAAADLPAKVLTAYPGDPCPESGEWYSVNWDGRRQTVNKGDPMPGPKYSSTGAVIWHRKQS